MEDNNQVNLSEIKDSLGTLICSFIFQVDPYALIKEIDIIMSFESAMLDVMGKWKENQWGEHGIRVDIPEPRKTVDLMTGTAIHLYPNEKNTKTTIVKNYSDLFCVFRLWWTTSVDAWNSQTGDWKKSIIICSKLRSDLLRIALKEKLISLNGGIYTIQMRGTPVPEGTEFFAGTET